MRITMSRQDTFRVNAKADLNNTLLKLHIQIHACPYLPQTWGK